MIDAGRRSRTVVHGAAALLALALVGCGSDEPVAEPPTTEPDTTTVPEVGTTNVGSAVGGGDPVDSQLVTSDTGNPVVTTTTTTTSTTLVPEVTTSVVGTAVGGNAGGEGRDQTDTNSELVRNPDGSCSGWELSGTSGLENGAAAVFLDRETREQIGAGRVTSSAWEDVDPGDLAQWNCTFRIEGEITTPSGAPEELYIAVGGLAPWLARTDPTQPGQYVASVDSQARIEVVSACADPGPFPAAVDEWSAVGIYWSRGIEQLCIAGLVVESIDRTCRPAGFASEYVVAVTRADDPSVVLEDAGGVTAAADALVPGTPVIARVTTGRPCG